MKRKIINIDEEKCNGCGLCIPGCPEGAIQLIDGKARLVSDRYCDGLGACLGHCPEGAITIEERDAETYDERNVMENVISQGENTIKAHLQHLREHGETDYLQEAVNVLKEKGMPVPDDRPEPVFSGCPGSQSMSFATQSNQAQQTKDSVPSQLTHWPVQLHLISPAAPHYKKSDLLLASDCSAFTAGDFHQSFLKDKTLAIACPKLDEGQNVYVEKIKALIEEAQINTLTVLMMQVPCCGGLLHMAQAAAEQATRHVPIKAIILGLQGDILREEWI
ncbi:MAG: 4Fe-4S dicluster domain-containing protein [candidate division KSB1 bacterium]|nr:4Fe-4S dicluster domain-containing protein [candidate division KSB1 bacterium]